jgi:peptidoglycan/xylan/chitin deacetylase (PgdA/CDA1 family)
MRESSARELELLAALAADGHAIEAHSVAHLNAVDYIAQHGLPAYVDDEVLPSLAILRDLGYTPTSFAYPFGAAPSEAHDAVLAHVERVRVSPGSCPY